MTRKTDPHLTQCEFHTSEFFVREFWQQVPRQGDFVRLDARSYQVNSVCWLSNGRFARIIVTPAAEPDLECTDHREEQSDQ